MLSEISVQDIIVFHRYWDAIGLIKVKYGKQRPFTAKVEKKEKADLGATGWREVISQMEWVILYIQCENLLGRDAKS